MVDSADINNKTKEEQQRIRCDAISAASPHIMPFLAADTAYKQAEATMLKTFKSFLANKRYDNDVSYTQAKSRFAKARTVDNLDPDDIDTVINKVGKENIPSSLRASLETRA